MKHIHAVTTHRPAEAALWQEILCSFALAIQALVGFKEGGAPWADFIVDQCDLPIDTE